MAVDESMWMEEAIGDGYRFGWLWMSIEIFSQLNRNEWILDGYRWMGSLIFWNSLNSFEIRICDFRRIAHFDSVHFWHFQADWSYIEGDRGLDVFWMG